jgi:hypothetical protein
MRGWSTHWRGPYFGGCVDAFFLLAFAEGAALK